MQSGSIASGPVLSSESVATYGAGQEDLLYDTMLVSAHPEPTAIVCPNSGTVCGPGEI